MKKLILKFKNRNEKLVRGFTVLETLVAITILLLSIVGPMEIAAKSLFAAFYARDEIIAYYLAQEGIEYVRSVRDTNILENIAGNTTDWLSGIEGTCTSANGCMINTTPLAAGNPSSSFGSGKAIQCDAPPPGIWTGCEVLNFDDSTGFYNYNTTGTAASKYTRRVKVQLTDTNSIFSALDGTTLTDQGAYIESEVRWIPGGLFGSEKSFILRERITNYEKI